MTAQSSLTSIMNFDPAVSWWDEAGWRRFLKSVFVFGKFSSRKYDTQV
jgi:hypothetical protein